MEDNKSSYRGSSDAQRRAVAKYQSERVENIVVRVPKGKKDYYKSAAAAAGVSLNQFAIAEKNKKIEREGL